MFVSLMLIALGWAIALPAQGSANVAHHFCLVLNTPSTIANPTQTAQRNAYVVLQAWEAKRAASLKAANPSLQVLIYQNFSSMDSGPGSGGLHSSGVGYVEADKAHPGWFLKDHSGNRIPERNWPWLWMADIGNIGYQQQWATNVLAILRAGPWDGVLMDDTNTTPKWHVDPTKIAAYPDDRSYQAAVRSMLAYVGPRIMAAGKLAIPNMGSWSEYPEVVEEWLPFVSGGMDEMFVKWGSKAGLGYAGPRVWRRQVEEVETAERMGKRFLAVTHPAAGETSAIRYGWASALLGASGSTAYFAAAQEYDRDTWSGDYDMQLGNPTSKATAIANGIWKRTFSNGLVVVNPTTSKLGLSFGGTYSGSGLKYAENANLAPRTALVLTRSTPPAPVTQEEKELTSGEGAPESGGSGPGSVSEPPEPPEPPDPFPSSGPEGEPSLATGSTPSLPIAGPPTPAADAEPSDRGEATRCRKLLREVRRGQRKGVSKRRQARCAALVRAARASRS